jgi:hypothetical protein
MDLAPLVLIVWRRKHKPTEFVPSIVGQMTFLGSPEAMDPPKKMRVERVFVSPTFRDSFRPANRSRQHLSSTKHSLVGPQRVE